MPFIQVFMCQKFMENWLLGSGFHGEQSRCALEEPAFWRRSCDVYIGFNIVFPPTLIICYGTNKICAFLIPCSFSKWVLCSFLFLLLQQNTWPKPLTDGRVYFTLAHISLAWSHGIRNVRQLVPLHLPARSIERWELAPWFLLLIQSHKWGHLHIGRAFLHNLSWLS